MSKNRECLLLIAAISRYLRKRHWGYVLRCWFYGNCMVYQQYHQSWRWQFENYPSLMHSIEIYIRIPSIHQSFHIFFLISLEFFLKFQIVKEKSVRNLVLKGYTLNSIQNCDFNDVCQDFSRTTRRILTKFKFIIFIKKRNLCKRKRNTKVYEIQ